MFCSYFNVAMMPVKELFVCIVCKHFATICFYFIFIFIVFEAISCKMYVKTAFFFILTPTCRAIAIEVSFLMTPCISMFREIERLSPPTPEIWAQNTSTHEIHVEINRLWKSLADFSTHVLHVSPPPLGVVRVTKTTFAYFLYSLHYDKLILYLHPIILDNHYILYLIM